MYLFLQGFWFILPAMWSNMAPLWAKRIPFLARFDLPVDANKKLFGKPVLGRNKTYRGFIAGFAFALGIGFVQWLLSEAFVGINDLEFIEMQLLDYMVLSALLGFGALAGDAIESLLKRQLDIPSGESWVPLDQIDYVIGAFVFASPVLVLEPGQYAAAGFIGIILHLTATFIGWKIGLKDAPI